MPRELCWYVGIAQLPGIPPRLHAACMEAAFDVLRQLPVASRRSHVSARVPMEELTASA